jgi:hypothetical protein
MTTTNQTVRFSLKTPSRWDCSLRGEQCHEEVDATYCESRNPELERSIILRVETAILIVSREIERRKGRHEEYYGCHLGEIDEARSRLTYKARSRGLSCSD